MGWSSPTSPDQPTLPSKGENWTHLDLPTFTGYTYSIKSTL